MQQLTAPSGNAQGTQKRRQRPDALGQGAGATRGRGKRRRRIRMPLADGSVQPGGAEEGLEDADMMDIDDAMASCLGSTCLAACFGCPCISCSHAKSCYPRLSLKLEMLLQSIVEILKNPAKYCGICSTFCSAAGPHWVPGQCSDWLLGHSSPGAAEAACLIH